MDGTKRIKKAGGELFDRYALIQRCQWHKRENVVGYLSKGGQAAFRKVLQRAYEQPTTLLLASASKHLESMCIFNGL